MLPGMLIMKAKRQCIMNHRGCALHAKSFLVSGLEYLPKWPSPTPFSLSLTRKLKAIVVHLKVPYESSIKEVSIE